MQYISKRHLIILMVIVVILAVMLLIGEHYSRPLLSQKRDMVPPTQVTTEQEKFLGTSGEPQNQMVSKSFIIRPGQSRLTYMEALDLYKNNTLQFNDDCQLVSNTRSFHLNNEVMIDNRSAKPNKFSIGDASIVLGPYDFGFMILRESGSDVSIGCMDHQNVATVSIE